LDGATDFQIGKEFLREYPITIVGPLGSIDSFSRQGVTLAFRNKLSIVTAQMPSHHFENIDPIRNGGEA
jgi:hypothetical protein